MNRTRVGVGLASCLLMASACGDSGGGALTGAEPSGQIAQRASTAPLDVIQQAALEGLRQNGALLGLSAGDAFVPRGVGEEDELGICHARFERQRDGLRVRGGDVVVHLEKRDGKLVFRDVSATLTKPFQTTTKPTIDAATATSAAAKVFPGSIEQPPTAALVIVAPEGDGALPALAYEVTLRGVDDESHELRRDVFVAAADARVLASAEGYPRDAGGPGTGPTYPRRVPARNTARTHLVGTVPIDVTAVYVSAASLVPTYYELRDPGRTITTYNFNLVDHSPGTLGTDADGLWGSGSWGRGAADYMTATAELHHLLAVTHDYFLNVHGRRGIAGARPVTQPIVASMYEYASYTAHWNRDSGILSFGGGYATDVAVWGPHITPDEVAHEYTHAVTTYSADLFTFGEAGAMNESISDVFGTLVDFQLRGEAVAGWEIGNETWRTDLPHGFERSLEEPTKDGQSFDHWQQYAMSVGSPDVHHLAGIPNKAFYLLAHGGTHRGSGVTVTGIGAARAGRIWYRALTTRMTSLELFGYAARDTIAAAVDLYGSASAEAASVRAAWSAVGVRPLS